MSNTIQSLVHLSTDGDVLDTISISSEQSSSIFPNQLIYSPIIKPIKSRLIDQKKIIKFEFKDKGKKVKKIKI
jgi:hypothetical protein